MLAESPTVKALRMPGFWDGLLSAQNDRYRGWSPHKLAAYRELLVCGEVGRMVDDYAVGRLALDPPTRRLLNKADGRKKVVYTFDPAGELFLKALNRVLQSTTAADHSSLCHSFQPGRGPRTAFRVIRKIRGLHKLQCLHLDIRDYFNSIPIEPLLDALPRSIRDDRPLHRLLSTTLRDPRVISRKEEVSDSQKGVMAGTPLAPLLSNLYLRSLDAAFEESGTPFVRYADDIVVFGTEHDIPGHRHEIERRLAALGLELNSQKTRLSLPGASWEFLGLRYDRGALDLSTNTAAKLWRRTRRIARRARTRPDPLLHAVRRLNRRLYGVGGRPADFTWASWFFPLLTRDATLRRLDGLVQDQLRFAVSGVYSRRNFKEASYRRLREAGYVPLVSAYHAYRRGPAEFDTVLDRCAEPEKRSARRVAGGLVAMPERPGRLDRWRQAIRHLPPEHLFGMMCWRRCRH